MARLKTLKIKGYRSIRDEVEVHFPEGKPLVLLGPNNAGKSNIVRAIDLLLGELWPGSRNPRGSRLLGPGSERKHRNIP